MPVSRASLISDVFWRLRASWALCWARGDSRRRLASLSPRSILVICHGNIYRSAFVGEYLRARVGSCLVVRSAGFYPTAGRASPDRHVEMCRAFDVDLSSHRSSVVTPDDIESADAVLLMDRSNWISLVTTGVSEKKLIWLGAWASGGGAEIRDPYRMDDADARRLLGRMAQCADMLANELTSARTSDRG